MKTGPRKEKLRKRREAWDRMGAVEQAQTKRPGSLKK